MATRKTPANTKPGVASVGDVPVTRAMLYGVRDELRARIDETNARIDGLSARVDGLSARVDGLSARIDETNARIDETNARIDALRAEVMVQVHRIGTLVEEQEARNRVVLEVVQGHNARFERIEASIEELREMSREILDVLRRRPSG